MDSNSLNTAVVLLSATTVFGFAVTVIALNAAYRAKHEARAMADSRANTITKYRAESVQANEALGLQRALNTELRNSARVTAQMNSALGSALSEKDAALTEMTKAANEYFSNLGSSMAEDELSPAEAQALLSGLGYQPFITAGMNGYYAVRNEEEARRLEEEAARERAAEDKRRRRSEAAKRAAATRKARREDVSASTGGTE